MNHCNRTVFAAAAALTVAVTPGAHADLVFGNFDDQTEFDSYLWVYSPADPNIEFEMAMPFTVTGGDFLLDSIVIPMLAHEGFWSHSGTSALFSIYADSASGPGALLESTAVIDSLPFHNDGPPFPAPVTASFTSSTFLQNGQTYWISATEANGTTIGWQTSPDIATSPFFIRNTASSQWNELAKSPLPTTFGLQVHGMMVPSPAMGLIVVVGTLRSRRRT